MTFRQFFKKRMSICFIFRFLKNCVKIVSDNWRKRIIYMHNQNYKITDISRILNMPKPTVWNTISKIFDAGLISDFPHSGRPRTARTPKRIKFVKERVRRNPKRSIRWRRISKSTKAQCIVLFKMT